MQGLGLGVLVASRPKPSAAHYSVKGPSEVEILLQRIAELPSSDSDGGNGSGSDSEGGSGSGSGDTCNQEGSSCQGSFG